MSNIEFQKWCIKNNLNPNKNTSKTAFMYFMKAFKTQLLISKISQRRQLNQKILENQL